ncbi:MAG: hypothetical protein ACHP7J_01625 [Terriglobales bacterium]
MEKVKVVFLLVVCALGSGCTRHQVDPDAKDRINVCGTIQRPDGAPASKALVELHKIAKDTPDDVVANSYELAETGDDGHFVLRSSYVGRQYWFSINSTRGCEGLSFSQLEAKRLPVTFHRTAVEGDCESKIKLVVDDHCNLKLQ